MRKTKILLSLCAIIGTLIGYAFVVWLIGYIPFWKYMMFELFVSMMHMIYNRTKNQALQNISNE